MDIHNLTTFITVAKHGSFSLAAETLHLTQPAISKRIAALESELETRLFDRIGRKVLLTEAGAILLPRAQRILHEVEDSRRLLTNLSGHIGGRLCVGTSHHIGLHRLPPVLREFTNRYPDVVLDLEFMDSEVVCNAVLHGDLELGIITLPMQPPEGLASTVVWQDQLHIVSGHDHALARRTHISAAELSAHAAILPGRGTYTRELLEQTMTIAGVTLNLGLSTNYLETIKMMVKIGLGWSILPQTMLDNDLHILNFDNLSLSRTLGVIRHQKQTLSNAARALLELLESSDSNEK